jgi:hypothetical protein
MPMPPTLRPSHGILYGAMQKVNARRVIGRVVTTLGPASLLDFDGGYDSANDQKVLPGMIVRVNQALETDVNGLITIQMENGVLLTVNNKAHVFFQSI